MVVLQQPSVISNSCMIDSEFALIALRNSSLSMKDGHPQRLLFWKFIFFCREVVEPAVDCLKESSVLIKCIVNVSSRSAHVVVLVPLIVDDCLKLGLTYHC